MIGWLGLAKRIAPILLVMAVIWFAMHLKGNYDKALLKADNAVLMQQKAEIVRDQWIATSEAQTKAVLAAGINLRELRSEMGVRDRQQAQAWAVARKEIATLTRQADRLIEGPAAAAKDEVAVARAKLKDTEGFNNALVPTLP